MSNRSHTIKVSLNDHEAARLDEMRGNEERAVEKTLRGEQPASELEDFLRG